MKNKIFNYRVCLAFALVSGISSHVLSQDPPKIETKTIPAQKAMVIRTVVPTNAVGQKMGELFGKLYGHLGQNGIQPAGAPFAVYYSFDPNGNTEFELSVPVNAAGKETDDIKFKEYPAMKVLSTLFVGPYEKVAPVYEAMKKYADDNKLQTKNEAWEVYLTDPSQESDPNKYKTLVYFVLKN